MPTILYTVRVTCPTIQVRGRFLAWLAPNHLLQVKAGGATTVRVILPDRAGDTAPARPEPVRGEPARLRSGPELVERPVESVERAVVETQYVFPSRKAFDTYLRDHAPALRTDALKHFPPESGVTFERQIAEIACELE